MHCFCGSCCRSRCIRMTTATTIFRNEGVRYTEEFESANGSARFDTGATWGRVFWTRTGDTCNSSRKLG